MKNILGSGRLSKSFGGVKAEQDKSTHVTHDRAERGKRFGIRAIILSLAAAILAGLIFRCGAELKEKAQ